MADRERHHEGARGDQPPGRTDSPGHQPAGSGSGGRPARRRPDDPWTVDCESCPVREVRCADCMVSALAGMPVVVQPTALSHGPWTDDPAVDTSPDTATGFDGQGRIDGPGLIDGQDRIDGPARTDPQSHFDGQGLAESRLPLDAAERRALDVFVRAGLVSAGEAARVTATREPWAPVARRRVAS